MYKELTVKNIKTFEEEQKLKIAPITLRYQNWLESINKK